MSPMAVSAGSHAPKFVPVLQSSERLVEDGDLVKVKSAASSQATAKSLTAASDLDGSYVITYESLTTTGNPGGGVVSIEATEDADSVTITNFYESGTAVKAKVDVSAGKLYIPNQVIGTSSYYGDYDLCYCSSDGTLDRSVPIEASIADDYTITFESCWGVFIVSGDYADRFYGKFVNTVIEKPNATMYYSAYSSSDSTFHTYSITVAASQTDDRTLNVRNFGGSGYKVDITLLSDSSAVIDTQAVFSNSYGDWCTYSAAFSDSLTLESYDEVIVCGQASDLRSVTWGEWTLMCLYGGVRYYSGIYSMGQITTTFDLSYPSPTSLGLEGSGTADSPYLISSADEWNALAAYMANEIEPFTGEYFKITADIDFTGVDILPLGYDGTSSFDGDLDGNGMTVKGFSYSTETSHFGALIATTGTNANIHDLTAEGDFTTSSSYCGGVVGYLAGAMTNVTGNVAVTSTSTSSVCTAGVTGYVAATGSMTDCVNQGGVSSLGLYAAGIVGFSQMSATFTRCANKGSVTYTGSSELCYAAGVAGYCAPCNFIGCWNEGTVSASGSSSGGLTGVLAYAAAEDNTTKFYLKDCYNTADISSPYFNSGVALTGGTYAAFEMDGCYNTGDITSTYTSTKGSTYTAGVSACYFRSSTYRGCWNSGDITTCGTAHTCGLFGYYKGTGSETNATTITGCYNKGNITTAYTYAAGIVSYVGTYTNIDSCYNTGDITSESYYCGGIAAYATSSDGSAITNCFNAGNITTSKNRVGGIIGNTSSVLTVANCFNVGDITTTNTTPGTTSSAGYAIGGIAGTSGAQFSNVYSAGKITGASRVGGLVGGITKNYTTLSAGYFCGAMSAPSDSCGNIFGVNISSTSVWSSSNSVDSTYYLAANSIADSGRDNVSVGLSYADLAALDLGDAWTAGDDYTYPRLATLADNDYAKAYAAAVIPADGDSYSSITTGFHVGAPDGVTWTASSDAVEISGNDVTFSEDYSGTLTMTASSGGVSVATELTCSVVVSGVGGVTAAREIVSEKFYTVAGAQAPAPADGQKAIYIVRRLYNDGTTETLKEIR